MPDNGRAHTPNSRTGVYALQFVEPHFAADLHDAERKLGEMAYELVCDNVFSPVKVVERYRDGTALVQFTEGPLAGKSRIVTQDQITGTETT